MICTFKLLLEGNYPLPPLQTHHCQLPANIAHCYSTSKKYTWQPGTDIKEVWRCVSGKEHTLLSSALCNTESPPITTQIHNYQAISTQKDLYYRNLISCSKQQRRLLIDYSCICSTKQSLLHCWQGTNFISISISNQISHT